MLGLGAIDIIILLPIAMSVLGTLLAMFITVIAGVIGGAVLMAAGPFFDPPGGPLTAILAGLGLMAGSTSLGAVTTMITIGLMNLTVWYGRLHYRLLKPAIDPQG